MKVDLSTDHDHIHTCKFTKEWLKKEKGGGGGMALSKPSFESHFKSLPLFLQEFEKSNACKISNIVYLKEFWKKEGSKI